MCLCVLSISTICIVTNGCKSYSFIVTLLKLLEILYGRSQRKEKKSQDQMGKLCLDLKVDLERIVFFSDQKIANCCCYFNYYKPSTTMLRSSLSFYLKAKLTKHLYMQRRSSFFAWISRKHTSTFNNNVSSEFSHQCSH